MFTKSMAVWRKGLDPLIRGRKRSYRMVDWQLQPMPMTVMRKQAMLTGLVEKLTFLEVPMIERARLLNVILWKNSILHYVVLWRCFLKVHMHSNPFVSFLFNSYLLSAPNPCVTSDGRSPCSHLCLITFNQTFSCACPHLMKLQPDKRTCKGKDRYWQTHEQMHLHTFLSLTLKNPSQAGPVLSHKIYVIKE